MTRSARFALLTTSVTVSGGPQAVEPLGREVGTGNGEQSCCSIAVVTSNASRQQCVLRWSTALVALYTFWTRLSASGALMQAGSPPHGLLDGRPGDRSTLEMGLRSTRLGTPIPWRSPRRFGSLQPSPSRIEPRLYQLDDRT